MKAIERLIGRALRRRRAGEATLFYHRFHAPHALTLESAFADQGIMAPIYLGTGTIKNISPPLNWEPLPAGTLSLVLVIEDYDVPFSKPLSHGLALWSASKFVALPEGALSAPVSAGITMGKNFAFGLKYAGPTPIRGHGPHHYAFQLFAADCELDLPAGFNRKQLAAKLAGHVTAAGVLTGICERD